MNDSAAVADAVARALEQFGAKAVFDALSDAAAAAGDHLAVPGNPVGHPSTRFHEVAKTLGTVKAAVLAAEKASGLELAQAADVIAEMAFENQDGV